MSKKGSESTSKNSFGVAERASDSENLYSDVEQDPLERSPKNFQDKQDGYRNRNSSRGFIRRLLKRARNLRIVSFLVARIAYLLLRILFATYNLKFEIDSSVKINGPEKQGIFYFWHRNIIHAIFFFSRMKTIGHCLISPSRDGQIAAFIARKFGFKVIFGSAYKMGIKAVKRSIEVLEMNKVLSLVGDGSRGPSLKLQKGILYLSAKTGVPTVFVECSDSGAYVFEKSWDKFRVPLPFSTITVKLHSPVKVTRDQYLMAKERFQAAEKREKAAQLENRRRLESSVGNP